MKTAPELDALVGQSHSVATKVELRAPDDSVVAILPVEAGTITGDATRRPGRWEGQITVAGADWAPDGPEHPLAGMTGHYCSIQRSGVVYATQPQTWVEIARLWVYETSITMSKANATLTVTLSSPARLLERAIHDDYAAHRNDPAQQMIADVLKAGLPYTPPVLDTSTPATIPAEFDPKDITPLEMAEQLASAIDVRVYFDALGRIVIRDTLDPIDTSAAPGRDLAVDVDVVQYTLTFGRTRFANDAIARFDWEDTQGQAQGIVGRAHIDAGPLAKDGPAGRMTVETQMDIDADQAKADAFAAAILTSQKQAWVMSTITAVQDPRIEPDDLVHSRYMDRDLVHRVVGVSFDLQTASMQLTARTALEATAGGGPGGGGGTPPSDPLATTVTAGQPGTFGPAGHRDPTTLQELETIDPGAQWTTPGDYVRVGGENYWWDGTAWVTGTVAQPPPPLATSVVAGQPGTFGPASHRPPSTLTELETINGGAAWTTPGDYVTVNQQQYWWDGNQWRSGQVPTPPPAHVVHGVWQAVPENINPKRVGELQFLADEIRLNPTDDNGQHPDFDHVQVGDTIRIQQSGYDKTLEITRIRRQTDRIFIETPTINPRPTMNYTTTTITIDH